MLGPNVRATVSLLPQCGKTAGFPQCLGVALAQLRLDVTPRQLGLHTPTYRVQWIELFHTAFGLLLVATANNATS